MQAESLRRRWDVDRDCFARGQRCLRRIQILQREIRTLWRLCSVSELLAGNPRDQRIKELIDRKRHQSWRLFKGHAWLVANWIRRAS